MGKLIVPKDLGDWLDTRDIGNKSLVFTLIDQLREQLKDEFSGKTREFVFDYKKELIEVLIGSRGYGVEQEPMYYAYIKGYEKITNNYRFWNYQAKRGEIIISTHEENNGYFTKMAKAKWLGIGIDDTNYFDTELHLREED